MEYTLNIKGRLLDLSQPRVMAIVNVTPDSFYATSRSQGEDAVARRVDDVVAQGADIIDIGACSTRPGAQLTSEDEERERLRLALAAVSRRHPEMPLSVDTFRPDVARMAVEEYGADIINDVSEGGGEAAMTALAAGITPAVPVPADAAPGPMLRMAARLGVAYALMSLQPTTRQTLLCFAAKVQQLRDLGQKDILLDPGFGFGKDVAQSLEHLEHLDRLTVLELPVLAALSRKSMVWRTLGCTPDEALNGTTVLNTIALTKGASILRVHDVPPAREAITLTQHLHVL